MNHYRVKRAHGSRRIGTTFLSDSPRDAIFMAMGFLQHLGNVDVPTRGFHADKVIVDEVAQPKVRKSRGVKVGTEPSGPAVVRDGAGEPVGGEDSKAG